MPSVFGPGSKLIPSGPLAALLGGADAGASERPVTIAAPASDAKFPVTSTTSGKPFVTTLASLVNLKS